MAGEPQVRIRRNKTRAVVTQLLSKDVPDERDCDAILLDGFVRACWN